MAENLNYISPIPFYSSLNDVDSMNDYAFGNVYKNILHKDSTQVYIPTFLLHTLFSYSVVQSVTCNLRSASDSSVVYQLGLNSISVIDDNGLATLLYNGASLVQNVALGKYYFEVYVFNGTTTQIFYSDYVYVTDDIHNYVRVSWYNDIDLFVAGRLIPFTQGFRPYCYVDSLIGKPEYSFEEESTERLGYQFIELQLSKKSYRFVFVAPEYLCDAMRLAKVCNHKQITRYDFPNYGKSFEPMNIDFTVEWEEQGNLAGVTLGFDVDNILSNTSGYAPLNGDFNNDYNNDFNNV